VTTFTEGSKNYSNVTRSSKRTVVVDWNTSGEVNGIRGQSYPTLGMWSLSPWTPVTLLSSPSYPTFASKVILEVKGRLPLILWALRCSWAHTPLGEEAPQLSKDGPNMLLNLGGFCLHPPLRPALGRRVTARWQHTCSFARNKRSLQWLP